MKQIFLRLCLFIEKCFNFLNLILLDIYNECAFQVHMLLITISFKHVQTLGLERLLSVYGNFLLLLRTLTEFLVSAS